MLRFIYTIIIAVVCYHVIADATLINRGGGIVYDDVLNISWLQDGDEAPDTGPSITKWTRLTTWAQDLSFRGYDDWRLASMDLNGDGIVVDCGSVPELPCRDNEYGHLFFYGLSGVSGQDKTGDQSSPSGATLIDVRSRYGWHGPPDPNWTL